MDIKRDKSNSFETEVRGFLKVLSDIGVYAHWFGETLLDYLVLNKETNEVDIMIDKKLHEFIDVFDGVEFNQYEFKKRFVRYKSGDIEYKIYSYSVNRLDKYDDVFWISYDVDSKEEHLNDSSLDNLNVCMNYKGEVNSKVKDLKNIKVNNNLDYSLDLNKARAGNKFLELVAKGYTYDSLEPFKELVEASLNSFLERKTVVIKSYVERHKFIELVEILNELDCLDYISLSNHHFDLISLSEIERSIYHRIFYPMAILIEILYRDKDNMDNININTIIKFNRRNIQVVNVISKIMRGEEAQEEDFKFIDKVVDTSPDEFLLMVDVLAKNNKYLDEFLKDLQVYTPEKSLQTTV